MHYAEALAYLDSRLNFERQGMPSDAELRLDRVSALLRALGSPHRKYPVVHIAGTKGKGSTAAMVAAALRSAGLRVGLHTSPHMDRVEERFAVDDVIPDTQQFADLVLSAKPVIDAIDAELPADQPELTFFEITTALAFEHFFRSRVDWAVIEVGMGGRLDATNVVQPAVSVITSISKDHTRQLGDDLGSIAREKAGIIKTGRPVVCGVLDPLPQSVIHTIATERSAPLKQLGRDFNFRVENAAATVVETWRQTWPSIELALRGEHQSRNCAVALATVDLLIEQNGLDASTTAVASQLAQLQVAGRFETIHERPTVIADVAHNEASAAALASTLSELYREKGFGRRVLLFGASRDKQWRQMLTTLCPFFDEVVLTTIRGNGRSMTLEEFGDTSTVPIPVTLAESPEMAWQLALEKTRSTGPFPPQAEAMVCVTGSFYLVAEIRRIVGQPQLVC